MVETISQALCRADRNGKRQASRLITPEYLRVACCATGPDNFKIEYCSRTENAYMVLIPSSPLVEWHADGIVAVVMQVVQDIGQKVELENMANTDSLTGLFNELVSAGS